MEKTADKYITKAPLEIFTGDNIRQMLLDNPDLPIAFLAEIENFSGEYHTEFASYAYADIGELLDCYQNVDECRIFTDRDDFEDQLRDQIWYDAPADLSKEETDKWVEAELTKQLAEYDKYWKKCILITVSN